MVNKYLYVYHMSTEKKRIAYTKYPSCSNVNENSMSDVF